MLNPRSTPPKSGRLWRNYPNSLPEEADRKGQSESLQLSRTRVLHDIETSQNPRYRATLEAALKHLDEKIAALS